MKVTLRQGASGNPARRFIQQMTKLNLMKGKKKIRHKSKLIWEKKRIINAPHNTNSYLINLYRNNHLENNREDEEEEWMISSGSMIAMNTTNIANFDDITIDSCANEII